MAKNKAPSPRPESDGSDAGDQQQQQQMDAGDEEEEEQVFEVEKIVSHKVGLSLALSLASTKVGPAGQAVVTDENDAPRLT